MMPLISVSLRHHGWYSIMNKLVIRSINESVRALAWKSTFISVRNTLGGLIYNSVDLSKTDKTQKQIVFKELIK